MADGGRSSLVYGYYLGVRVALLLEFICTAVEV